MALLLGIAGAVLGTQCPAQGAQLGICSQAGDVVVTGSTAAAMPPAAKVADPAAPGAATVNALEPEVPAAPPAAPEKAVATLSAHDLIEASHERLLLAQAKRPLFAGSPGANGDEGDGREPTAAATPAPLSYAAAPAPLAAPKPPVADRAAAPPVRAEFGRTLPPMALSKETEDVPVETAGVGGPLLPPLPEPEPLSLPVAAPDAGETPETDAPEAPDVAPVATATRVGDSRVNVRAGPSTTDARLFALDPGEQVTAIESSGGWMKVEDAAGRSGWVFSELLSLGDGDAATAEVAAATAPANPPAAPAAESTPDPPAREGGTRTVAGTGVSVREAPSNSGARMFALAAGEEVSVTGSDKGWLRITDSRGRTGWAYSNFFTPEP